MGHDSFSFKCFSVRHSRSAMKVGTDGVLLGAWFDPQGVRMLDVGTGTGLIAMMAAQRNASARIDAVEIDPGSCSDAVENFRCSPWFSRLTLFEASFVRFRPGEKEIYDRIFSNPPYFVASLKSPDPSRTQARHTESLTHEQLLGEVSRLLSREGRFSVILPAARTPDFVRQAQGYDLYPCRMTSVVSVEGTSPKRTLLEFTFGKHHLQSDTLVIAASGAGAYSAEYRALTKDFYLRM